MSNETCSKLVKPLQGSFSERINEKHIFDVKYDVACRGKPPGNREEFMNPIPAQTALEDKHLRFSAFWNRNAQHA